MSLRSRAYKILCSRYHALLQAQFTRRQLNGVRSGASFEPLEPRVLLSASLESPLVLLDSPSTNPIAVAEPLVNSSPDAQTPATVTYRLDVINTWSELTHPGHFPSDAHFSWFGGSTHNDQVSFWDVGELASSGIKQMAENGATYNLEDEVNAAIADGTTDSFLSYRHWFCPPDTSHANCGTSSVEFDVNEDFPLVTLVSMLGPSPDWFVGVSGLALMENGQWVPEMTIDLRPFDAGTISENQFALGGTLTDPPDPVSLITADSGQLIGPDSLGTFVFTRIAPAGITVTPQSGLVTTETGESASFEVVLDSQPADDVTIGITSNDDTEGAVSKAAVTFTADNWSTPQTVTVTGLDDHVNDGDISYTVVIEVADSEDPNYNGLDAEDVSVTNIDDDPAVVGRHIFYNNSAFDAESDDAAIAPSPQQASESFLGKTALLPGQLASFANYTSFSNGINGILVDIADRPQTDLTVDDFEFRVGNDNDPSQWDEAPTPMPITVRHNEGVDSSDRITIIWSDHTIQNQWLQVTVKATDHTGLADDDVFYFGNAIGETGNSPGGAETIANANVDVFDVLGVRDNATVSGVNADIDNNYDFDRDGRIDVVDLIAVLDHRTHGATALALITVPNVEVSITAQLANDTAPGGTTNTDGITSDPAVTGRVGFQDLAASVRLGLDGSFVPITDQMAFNGAFNFDRNDLEALFGDLVDGEHVLTVVAEDDLGGVLASMDVSFTLDTVAPTVVDAPAGTLDETFSFFDIGFSEAMADTAFNTASYSLVVDSGPNDGEVIPIDSVTVQDQQTVRIHLAQPLPKQQYILLIDPSLSDVAGNALDGPTTAEFSTADPAGIEEISPVNGEQLVRLQREIVIELDQPIDPDTVSSSALTVLSANQPVAGMLRVSSDNRRIMFFPDELWQASTRVRIEVDGDQIMGIDGLAVDADGDELPGGTFIATFDTVADTRIEGTAVTGFVFDSNNSSDDVKIPVVGATLTVEGSPGLVAVTDENGFFRLENVPAPEFFVDINGKTATNAPEGRFFGRVTKPFHSVAGHEIQLGDDQPFDIYLPLIIESDAITVTPGEMTMVLFSDSALDLLESITPDVDRAVWGQLAVEIPPDSLFFNDGQTLATEVRIFPLDKDRIPVPLPKGFDPKIVFSLDAGGAENFDVPAKITYPNVDGLAPGEQRFIFSFDHDAGEWVPTGTMMVSEDGSVLVSDDGVQTVGWRFLAPNPGTPGGGQIPPDDRDDDEMPRLELSDDALFFHRDGQRLTVDIRNTGSGPLEVDLPGQISGRSGTFFKLTRAGTIRVPEGQSTTIEIEATNPPLAQWKSLQGPEIFATTITVSSDGGSEDIFLIRLLDAGDRDAADGRIEFNTTTLGVTRHLNVALEGPAAADLDFDVSAGAFGGGRTGAGLELTYTPTGPSASDIGVLAVKIGGSTVGGVVLAGQSVAVQEFHLNRDGFVSALTELIQTSHSDPAIDAIYDQTFRAMFPGGVGIGDVFDQYLKPEVMRIMDTAGLDAGLIINDDLPNMGPNADQLGGNVVSYHKRACPSPDCRQKTDQNGQQFPEVAQLGEGTIDFDRLPGGQPRTGTFFSLVNEFGSIPAGQTYFQFAELINPNPKDANLIFIGSYAFNGGLPMVPESQRKQALGEVVAKTIVHEFLHNVGGWHTNRAGGTFAINPSLGQDEKLLLSVALHGNTSPGDVEKLFDIYRQIVPGGGGGSSENLPNMEDQLGRPVLTVDGTTLVGDIEIDFGLVAADGSAGEVQSRTFVLGNVGDEDLLITDVQLGTGFAFDEPVSSEFTLTSGETLTVSVRFDPPETGPVNGVLSFETSDTLNHTIEIPLVGIGQDLGGDLDLDLESLNAGGVLLGSAIDSVLTMTNTGSASIQILSIEVEGDRSAFTVIKPDLVPLTLLPNEAATIELSFNPGQLGLIEGDLIIATNDQDDMESVVHLIGTGLDPRGGPLIVAGAYVAVVTDNGFVQRSRLPSTGRFDFVLPADALVSLVAFEPRTGLVSHAVLTTSDLGQPTDFGILFYRASDEPDSDGDGLPDDAEFAIGTSDAIADTDGDGIDDLAEIEQGLDPLDERGFPTGIIATLHLEGEANEVVVEGSTLNAREQTAYVATGSYGLAIINTSEFNNPKMLGQINLPGDNTDVSVDSQRSIAAVAAGARGVHLVDVSDPITPTLMRTIFPVAAASRVEVHEGLLYVAGDSLSIVDIFSGDPIQTIDLEAKINDIALEGQMLYAVTSNDDLHVIDISGIEAEVRGVAHVSTQTTRLFVGNGIAYIANGIESTSISIPTPSLRGGYATVDVSNPDNPNEISGIDTPQVQAGNLKTVTNGSGLALVAGGFRGLEIHRADDPENTYEFVTQIPTPGVTRSVTIAAGIGFVADDSAGLHVMNYESFDTGGQPPTVTISAPVFDVDPNTPGVQVEEGSSIPIVADVTDDVQIRNVELIVDGRVVQNTVSFPFDLSAIALGDKQGAPTVNIQVRATDTGGNVAVSEILALDLVPDTIAPFIVSTSVTNALRRVQIEFSEPMAAETITAANFQLRDNAGQVIGPLDIQVGKIDRLAQLTYESQPLGVYEWVINAAAVTDRAGNSVGSEDLTMELTVGSDGPLFPGPIFAVGRRPFSMAMGDFDGDGFKDLVTANASSNTVSVLLGNGDGTFAGRNDFTVGANPLSVSVSDFNGDGFQDLATGNSHSHTASVLLGNGDGTFADRNDFAVGNSPSSVTVGDIDGDGFQDLVTTNEDSNTASVLLGNGDGTFADRNDFAVGNSPGSVSVSDFNGDEFQDLATANANSNTVSVLLGNGDGTFADRNDFTVGNRPSSVTVGDIDGDGFQDLAITNYLSSTVSVLLGNGDGTFADRNDFTVGDRPGSVSISDFNGDGLQDLATRNSSRTVSVLLGKGDGTFPNRNDFPIGTGFLSVAGALTVGDIDGDGFQDLATMNASSHTVSVFLGKGDGTFASRNDFAVGANPVSVAVSDFNGDGFQDLATGNSNSHTVSVLLGNGDGNFANRNDFAVGDRPASVSVSDFNGDGFQDLATANENSNTVSVLLGNGDGTFASRNDFAVGTKPKFVSVSDFNGDGFQDLATANANSNTVSVLLGNGDGTFASRNDFAVGTGSYSVTVSDFNGDGFQDLATGNGESNTVSVLLGNVDGTFADRNDFALGNGSFFVTVGDFNGDGYPDLISANRFSNTVSVLLGNGDGTFAPRDDIAMGSFPVAVAVDDFDGDGFQDLAITISNSNAVSVLLGNGDGTFAPRDDFAMGSFPVAVAVGDFDGDGFQDLAVANLLSPSAVSVLLNRSAVVVQNSSGAVAAGDESSPRGLAPMPPETMQKHVDRMDNLVPSILSQRRTRLSASNTGLVKESNLSATTVNTSEVTAGRALRRRIMRTYRHRFSLDLTDLHRSTYHLNRLLKLDNLSDLDALITL